MVSLVSLEYVSGLESELKPRNAESGKIRYVSVFMSVRECEWQYLNDGICKEGVRYKRLWMWTLEPTNWLDVGHNKVWSLCFK